MNGFDHFWQQGDVVTKCVAIVLLLMSISAWVVIFWKVWLLRRARTDVSRGIPLFWAAPDIDTAHQQLQYLDREQVIAPLVAATLTQPQGQTLESQAKLESQLTRRLRDALHDVLEQLRYGQVLLASIGSTSPFVGLFGTVWGIYHALGAISGANSVSIEKIAGPVGEALIMTAAGLAVAIPAVLAYNIFGKRIGELETDLEGFAFDLREMQTLLPAISPEQQS